MLRRARESILWQTQNCLRSSRIPSPPSYVASARFLSSLAILEQREGKIQNASLSAITAAQKLGGSITGFIAGSGLKSVVQEAAKVKGLDRIIMIENAAYDKVGISPIRRINFAHSLTTNCRVFPKITPLCLLRTSRKKDLPTF